MSTDAETNPKPVEVDDKTTATDTASPVTTPVADEQQKKQISEAQLGHIPLDLGAGVTDTITTVEEQEKELAKEKKSFGIKVNEALEEVKEFTQEKIEQVKTGTSEFVKDVKEMINEAYEDPEEKKKREELKAKQEKMKEVEKSVDKSQFE